MIETLDKDEFDRILLKTINIFSEEEFKKLSLFSESCWLSSRKAERDAHFTSKSDSYTREGLWEKERQHADIARNVDLNLDFSNYQKKKMEYFLGLLIVIAQQKTQH